MKEGEAMTKEENLMLNDFLQDENVVLLMNDDMKVVAKKIDLITQQALLQEEYQNKLNDLNAEFDKLNKKKEN